MALASAGPIQIGSTLLPSFSRRMTTGVLEVRSSPRWATVTSIIMNTFPGWPAPQLLYLGARIPAREILDLFGRERVDRDAHALQLELCDLLVYRRRQPVDGLRQRRVL